MHKESHSRPRTNDPMRQATLIFTALTGNVLIEPEKFWVAVCFIFAALAIYISSVDLSLQAVS